MSSIFTIAEPGLASFIPVEADSHWPIQNLPYGVFTPASGGAARCGTRVGDTVVDLSALAEAGIFDDCGFDASCFGETTLNTFMSLGRPAWSATRKKLLSVLSGDEDVVSSNKELCDKALHPAASVTMHLPAKIWEYTDFYSSREHATNVGVMFRGKDNALQPNWLHLPVGYHGRASSVVNSGTPVRRPCGQLQVDRADPSKGSTFGPCRLMDFELEMGMFVGPGNPMGTPLKIEDAEEHIFGLCLMNDWSARDIQKWEYVPLGPFTAKNFATSISPWIVTLDALEPFRCATSAGEQKDPEPLPYLRDPNYSSYNIDLEVAINGHRIARSNFSNLYWSVKQQLVHHTVSGCNMTPGDLLGSGTISAAYGGDEDSPEDAYGSMLELTWMGKKTIPLAGGEERKFLKDGDDVAMTGWCQGAGFRVGFGECTGQVLPPHTS